MSLGRKWTNSTFDTELNWYLPDWKRIGDVKNGNSNVTIRCGNGHTIKVTPSKIKSLSGECIKCITHEQQKKGYEQLIDMLNKEGYIPLFTPSDYIGSSTKLSALCPNEKKWNFIVREFIGFGSRKKRCRCALCKNTINPKSSPVNRAPQQAIDEMFCLGFEVMVDDYVNLKTPVDGKWTKCGHIETKRPEYIIYKTTSCKQCRIEQLVEKIKIYQKGLGFIIKNEVQLENITVKHTIDIICEKGHLESFCVQNVIRYSLEDFQNKHAFVCKKCMAEHFSGERCNFYINGQSLENRDDRNGTKYRTWCKGVKKLFELCAVCKVNPVDVSHHLYSFNKFENVRYFVENGIGLCNACHNLFHDKYLYGNNTVEQFQEFLVEHVQHNTDDLQEHLEFVKPKLIKAINKNIIRKKEKVYSIRQFALMVNEDPEIIRILIMHGKIKGAYQDEHGNWVVNEEDAANFLSVSNSKRKRLLNDILVGSKYGNLEITKILGRRKEGKKGQLRLFVETKCICGKKTEKPYYSLQRGNSTSCAYSCEYMKKVRSELPHRNQEVVDKVTHAYLNGEKTKEILEKFNIGKTTLYRYLRLKGIFLKTG